MLFLDWSLSLFWGVGFQLFYMATTSWCLEEQGSPLVKIMEMTSMSVTWSISDGRCSTVEGRSPTGSMDRSPAKTPCSVVSGMKGKHLNSSLSVLLQAMVIINGFLYVFGGTTGYIYSTDLHRLDLTTREWMHLKPNNTPDDFPEERWA